ncbi:hypothetical protein BX600DRAFT_315390 [Xylariales sp. PMI_506]|nr:hypothetical protein BX600DRAFT_315390 [Xylariales sp. PMI_506]
MNEQNGIDILCDAAGSDLLLDSLFVGATVSPREQPLKRTKLSGGDSTSASSPHVCHVCKRVYERADHLTRHLRSHENARPYQCSRCPKRFNRADLLTRHETTHDRNEGAKGRTVIRRSDRAAEACMNCAASKAKCDDQKPCTRCRNKNLPCQTTSRRDSIVALSDVGLMQSSTSEIMEVPISEPQLHVSRKVQFPPDMQDKDISIAATPYQSDYIPQPSSLMEATPEDMFYFQPAQSFFQDMDFNTSWDLNFDSYSIPQLDATGPSPQSSTTSTAKHLPRDPTRGYAAFKRSPWLWEPKTKDSLDREHEGLTFNEETISDSPAYERMLASHSNQMKMGVTDRDRLFSLVLSQVKSSPKIPTFPSLDLLNYLLQTHFVQDEYQTESWVHSASFDPSKALPELIGALISSGATFIAVPAIWQFGLALQEVVRIGLSTLFERSNAYTRDLQCLQAFMLQLDIGLWSGFKRKMEMAESFILPPMTMLRRAGAFSADADFLRFAPSSSDSREELHSKWHKFIKRESYKRLVLHVFFHDAQGSIAVQRNPLMSYTELSISLPAARDLWRAPTAEAWRDVYLRKKPLPPGAGLPRVLEIMPCVDILDSLEDFVDMELCYAAVLYGFWGQVSAYREANKFYQQGNQNKRNPAFSHRLWLTSQHKELYHEISEFALQISSSSRSPIALSLVADLLMMILYVSPAELQRFAGKEGEDEAKHAAASLEQNWIGTRDARHAVWHAGQVIRNARLLPPASLRGFNAIAVYFAALTLWIYGLLSCATATQGKENHEIPELASYILVDGIESRETRGFLQLDRGVPGISTDGDGRSGAESLSNPGMVLSIVSAIFRNNYPVKTEPLPPLVESLGNLLRDLGTGTVGRPSRVQSRAVTEERD